MSCTTDRESASTTGLRPKCSGVESLHFGCKCALQVIELEFQPFETVVFGFTE